MAVSDIVRFVRGMGRFWEWSVSAVGPMVTVERTTINFEKLSISTMPVTMDISITL